MFSLSSNFLRSTTIIQSPLICHGTLLLISSSNTSGVNNNLFMPVIDVSFNLKVVFKFKRFFVYFHLIRVSISTPSLLSTELKMICFEVKMTGYDKQYTFTHTYPHLLQKVTPIHIHQNLKEKLQIPRLLKLVLKGKVSADHPRTVPPLRDLVRPLLRPFLANF